ncbi:hypothetical protein [Corynebacterium sp. HMSC29G08]|uniref:Rv1157c family protein n=1 Tax=Corynebacterium sp. HMSC29G08 TaxID=1581069 RepID=UPI000A5F71C6|nr:hypothetical protein [Corynebacterium sp. HMSC29G08]
MTIVAQVTFSLPKSIRASASTVLTALSASLLVGASVFASAASAQASSASFGLLDELGRPTPQVVQRVHDFADKPFVPDQVANALRTAITFYAGGGELGGPPLPEDAPPFTQFYWPTVSSHCIGPGLHSTASALVVPGPATTPAPGANAGEVTFVFTALGTPAAAPDQGLMKVYWINLNNFRTGVTPLDNNLINPSGPATLSATAKTGTGRVLAVVDGGVRTQDRVCNFAPTAASFSVR